jgi:tetratricopeptide (TPR) repeat protein
VWDEARAEAARRAFAGTGLAYAEDSWSRARARIDAYAAGWVAMHEDACRATRVEGRQSDTLLDLRMACLDRRRDLLGALVELWTQRPDPEGAVDAAARLPSLAECADARALVERAPDPSDPALAARVAAARRSVDGARALHLAGRVEEARRAAAAARIEAEATDWPPARADAAFAEAEVLAGVQDPGAEARYLEAARLAAQGRDDRLAARALVRLAVHLGDTRSAQRALLAVAVAEGAVARAGDDEELRVELLVARGLAHAAAEDYAAARAVLTTAQDHRLDPRHPLAVRAIGELAGVVHSLREQATAQPLAEKALAAEISMHGPDHPRVSARLVTLGRIVADRGQFAVAAGHHRRALAIAERAGAPETAMTANALNGLAVAEDELGRTDVAAAALLRALAIRERLFGPEHANVAQVLHNMGVNHRLRGRFDDALAAYARAAAIQTKLHGAEHPAVARVLWAMGLVHENRGDHAAALELFSRAQAIREKALGVDHELTHQVRAHAALALASLGRCAEARRVAAVAVPALEKQDPKQRNLYFAFMALGRCDLAAGEARRAAGLFERAASIQKTPRQQVYRGIARAWLARATPDRRAALRIAAEAEADLVGRPEAARELAALRAWAKGR